MRVRTKLFGAFVVFTLLPLWLVVWFHHHGIQWLATTLSDSIEADLREWTTAELERSVLDAAAFLESQRRLAELAALNLAADTQRLLRGADTARPTGRDMPSAMSVGMDKQRTAAPLSLPPDEGAPLPLVEASRFDAGDPSIPGLTVHPRYAEHLPGGLRRDLPHSFEAAAYRLTPEARGRSAAQLEALAASGRELVTLFREIDETAFRFSLILGQGLYVTYPGQGGLAKDFDAHALGSLEGSMTSRMRVRWSVRSEPHTKQAVYTVTRPVVMPGGRVLGLASVDVLISEMLLEEDLASEWTDSIRTYLVTTKAGGDAEPEGALRVIGEAGQEEEAATGPGQLNLRTLEMPSGALLTMAEAINDGGHGVLEAPHDGEPALWAYAALQDGSGFVAVMPRSALETIPDKAVAQIRGFTDTMLENTFLATALLVCLLAFAAMLGARYATRPLMRVMQAADRLADGDFEATVDMRFGDERDHIVRAINTMGPRLKDYMRLSRSMELAQEIQQRLLPGEAPQVHGLSIARLSTYCDETGGDYYDFVPMADGRLALVVGDVSGHGVPSALLMATARAFLRQRVDMAARTASDGATNGVSDDPALVVGDINRRLTADVFESGQFMTLFYCDYDPATRLLRWVRAGHDPALLLDPETGEFGELKGPGLVLGVDGDHVYETSSITLAPGQTLVIGTDGIWEMHDAEGRMFGHEAFMETVAAHAAQGPDAVVAAVAEALEIHRGGAPAQDDVTLVVARVS